MAVGEFEFGLADLVHAMICRNAFARHQENRQQSNAEASESQDDPSLMWYGSEAEATEVMVYHTAILRNKRLLMAYTYVVEILFGFESRHLKSSLFIQKEAARFAP
jgi:hypothetical protein